MDFEQNLKFRKEKKDAASIANAKGIIKKRTKMTRLEFTMPKMGESITEGTIISWLVQEGDSFNEGDILCEVATDKVDNEVPAPGDGVMLQHLVKANDIVPVGAVIAVLELSKQVKETVTSEVKKESPEKARKKKSKPIKGQTQKAFKVNDNVFVSPLVESIAREHHISFEELARIPGTGKDARLRKSDLMDYISEGRPFKFAQAVVENNGFSIPDLKFCRNQ